MKRILIPIDFTEYSLNAISYGQVLFEKSETTFYLFAAFQTYAPSITIDEWGNEWESEEVDLHTHVPTEELEKVMQEVKRNNTNGKHRFKIESTVDTLENGMLECATRLSADYIIMSTKGAKGMKQFFLGSNAVTIINKVLDCPVIVVPRSYALVKSPLQVVFSTNFKRPFNISELQPLLDLLQCWGAELKIVQLMEDSYLDKRQKLHRDALIYLLGELPHYFHKIIYETSETKSIRDFVNESQSDMIALIYHKESFFYDLLQENVVEKTAFNSQVPLLVLRGLE